MTAAAALAAVAKWQIDTTVLHGRLSAHGEAMSGSAASFSETEVSNAADIGVVGDEGSACVDL
ncbi:hypothetical protein LV457_01485 [Mycobacterium sp. MYCO198283]|uniref:hypothetical protein n=1 Tax=Mycobacterium sp. MYCO198283 TaxID=2883505 RepID=UPI001E45857B|nr:hypothetical protein [Mycobacterium sp. MYCO198283]MCG5430970.1 hypothetical protein [Mycobacterium sp. MYCO198283]